MAALELWPVTFTSQAYELISQCYSILLFVDFCRIISVIRMSQTLKHSEFNWPNCQHYFNDFFASSSQQLRLCSFIFFQDFSIRFNFFFTFCQFVSFFPVQNAICVCTLKYLKLVYVLDNKNTNPNEIVLFSDFVLLSALLKGFKWWIWWAKQ